MDGRCIWPLACHWLKLCINQATHVAHSKLKNRDTSHRYNKVTACIKTETL